MIAASKDRQCIVCQHVKTLNEKNFQRYGGKDGDWKTVCRSCQGKARRQRRMDRIEKKAVSHMLDAAAIGGANIPHTAELLEAILHYFGGTNGFAALLLKQYFESPPGSRIRTSVLEMIVRLASKNTEQGGAKKPIQLYSEEELEQEIDARIRQVASMTRVSGRIVDAQEDTAHQCMASETLVIGGNRSGKSLCTFIEDAWAATGTHPIEGKYPKEGGNLVIVGANWKHVGLVIVPYLFRAGAFKIIKDRTSGEWRAFDPMLLGDKEREAQAKPAPPLIPPRMIKSMSWLLKSAGYLNSCELTNGWTIYCFSSEGDPPQGFQANRVHLDEDLNNEQWVPEMQARLADRRGRFTWSAMPHSKNEALIGLNERSEKAESIGNTTDIRRFVLRFLDNPHIDADEKRKMLERWAALGEDVLRQRSEGEFMTDRVLVYPSFNMSVHGYNREEMPSGQVPDDWCRYAIVDPGHSVTAVLFAAVPPQGNMILCYDELYIRECNAIKFAKEFHDKVGRQQFYAFLIDAHGGRITDIGSGRTAQEQYSQELRAATTFRLACRPCGTCSTSGQRAPPNSGS